VLAPGSGHPEQHEITANTLITTLADLWFDLR
jgi:hypothetical protein